MTDVRPRLDPETWQKLNERRRTPTESTDDVIERLLDQEDRR